jgi:SprA-related family
MNPIFPPDPGPMAGEQLERIHQQMELDPDPQEERGATWQEGPAEARPGVVVDPVAISAEAQEAFTGGEAGGGQAGGGEELSAEDQLVVQELRARDAEVRAHEQAHAAAGGAKTSGASYTFETGPDGKRYAVDGEVSIQVSEGRTPQETIRNAEQARRAALAPRSPSGQDRSVAAKASQMAANARAEATQEQAPEAEPRHVPGHQAKRQVGDPA